MAPEPLDISEHELPFKATNLSKLASIDLSQYLEAYMRNIRNLYNNSSAVKKMNFAEAAMVIQNSLIIFAKNVDSIWARAMSIRLALSANIYRKKITMMKIMRIVMLELVKKVQSKKKRLRRRKSEHLMLKNFNSFLFSILIKILI
ncbi:unnamed protein product [Bemisia tabaci]|uniref:Condensin II complex subunit H2 N-terminal domain-containing protein n=1 Tax=Bemisia tabaci TaxID=7038 RepID=A0A9P0AE14_BEMTA|nr:unnamed protein product [Bemisia tabaci]